MIMELQQIWIILIAVLWMGYFVLEGFDFGVGILLPVLGKNEQERRAMLTTLGPVWDGNEVWLLVAGGATFAAFPEWYATLFSGFYLPLLLILVALIIRGVAFEYRSKRSSLTWRKRWDAGDRRRVVPARAAVGGGVRQPRARRAHQAGRVQQQLYDGGFFNLLNPYALIGGLVTLTLFVTHGAIFLALKTDGDCGCVPTRSPARSGSWRPCSPWSSCCGRSWPSATRPGPGRWSSSRRSRGWRDWR
jgi:cytochrome d ubiquinol oxidase subunit II